MTICAERRPGEVGLTFKLLLSKKISRDLGPLFHLLQTTWKQLATWNLQFATWGTWDPSDILSCLEQGTKKHCHFHLLTVTFEHRHENKSCSPCPKDQHKDKPYDMWHLNYKLLSDFQTFLFYTLLSSFLQCLGSVFCLRLPPFLLGHLLIQGVIMQEVNTK